MIPGWRALDKYAVACGGGVNHRMGLYDAAMVKDNHYLGKRLAEGARELRRSRPGVPLIVECDTPAEATRALARLGPDRISIGRLTHSAPALDLGLDLA